MTREEAIKWMEETIQDAEGLLDKCSPALKEEVLEQNEVFKIAISALRSAPQPGKPLTLDQLREISRPKLTVEDFFVRLDKQAGSGSGISTGTIYKLRKIAVKEGFLEE